MPDRVTIVTTEPPDVPEFFVEGLARIEEANGNVRFVFYATRNPAPGWHGLRQRIVRVHLLMPADLVCGCAMQAAEAARKIHAGGYRKLH